HVGFAENLRQNRGRNNDVQHLQQCTEPTRVLTGRASFEICGLREYRNTLSRRQSCWLLEPRLCPSVRPEAGRAVPSAAKPLGACPRPEARMAAAMFGARGHTSGIYCRCG